MSKNANEKIQAIGLAEAFAQYQDLSLRKIAQSLEVNYNMLLKAGKSPVPGETYNPELINFAAVEVYLRKKLKEAYDTVDWESIAANAVTVSRAKEKQQFEIGSLLTIRNDDRTYQVMFTTPSHIVIMDVIGTQPRVFSWFTFEHQTPRKTEVATLDGNVDQGLDSASSEESEV